MKKVLILGLLAFCAPLVVRAAPQKPLRKVTQTVQKTVLQWPRFSRGNPQDHWWETIGDLQMLLNARGAKLEIDGDFGSKTEAAVKNFQKRHRLKVDGIVGPQTWAKLIFRLKRGDKGAEVRVLQSAMMGHDGEWHEELGKEPGVFGFETEKAVRFYQKEAGIQVDGLAGPQTWCILFGGKVVKK